MFELAVFVGYACVAALVVVARQRTNDALWMTVARRLGWTYTNDVTPTLEATIEQRTVTIVRDEGALHVTSTLRAVDGFSFSVRRSGTLRISGEPISIGEPFDSAFMLDSRDEALARAWFNRELVSAFRPVARGRWHFQLDLRGGTVVARFGLAKPTMKQLHGFATLVAKATNGRRMLRARWAELAAALHGELANERGLPLPAIVLDRVRCIVRIEVLRSAGWITRTTCTPTTHAEPIVNDLDGIVLDAERLRQLIDVAVETIDVERAGPYR